jgi:hypothetical protein
VKHLSKEQKAHLWGLLHKHIRNHGGFVTSPPNSVPVRFECVPGSALPGSLEELGYTIRTVGSTERLLPGARDQVSPTAVDIFEIDPPCA